MNKTTILIALVAVLLVASVAAIQPLPKGSCTWTRPATEYRPEKTFPGVWVRLSTGAVECRTVGKRHRPIPASAPIEASAPEPVVVPEPVPVCDNVTVCHKEQVKVDDWCWNPHRQGKHWCGWHWECKDVCVTNEVCALPV